MGSSGMGVFEAKGFRVVAGQKIFDGDGVEGFGGGLFDEQGPAAFGEERVEEGQ